MYIRKLKKEMTECRIIQVQKFLKNTKPIKTKVAYDQLIKQHIQLQQESGIINLYLNVTNKCNFNCYFCSQDCNTKGNSLSISDAKQILNIVHKLGFVNVYYTGGEPLLNNDIYEIVKYGYSLGFNQCLITNGFLINNNQNIIKYIDKFGISLHGDRTTYEKIVGKDNVYDKIIDNIRLLKKQNKYVEINYTLCDINFNYQQLEQVANFCKQEGIKMSVARINYLGKASNIKTQDVDNLCSYIDTLNNNGFKIKISNCVASCLVRDKFQYLCHGCGAAISTISIDCFGNVSICASSKKVEGNVFYNNLKLILKKIKLNEIKRIKALPQCCKICKNLVSCKGGCKIECNNGFSCDYLLNDDYNVFCKNIINKYIILNTNKLLVRHDKVVLPYPLRLISKKYLDFLIKLNGMNKMGKIMSQYNNKEELFQLLYCLYKDNYLIIKDDHK